MSERTPLTMADIERLAATYAAANEALALANTLMSAEINAVIRARMPAIRDQIEQTAKAHEALRTAVASAPQLFAKPRTRVLSGVKVGFQRLKSALAIRDEAPVLARIHALMPDRVEELIRTREVLRRAALEALPAADLKRLGVGLVTGSDAVVVKLTTADAIKSVEAVLYSWQDAADADDGNE